MSWESDVTAASGFLGAANQFNSANSKNAAVSTEASYQDTNISNNTQRRAGSLQTSYLQSGIALDPNTAVNNVVTQAYGQGITDIQRTNANASAQISNNNAAARTAVLSGLGSTALKIFGGNQGSASSGGGSFFGSFLQTGDTNALGQSVGGALDPSPTDPYQPPSWMQ